MGTPWRAQGVRISIVHRYGTVERSVEPPRVPSCQNRVPTETRRNPTWPDGTRRALTDHSTVPYQCTTDTRTYTDSRATRRMTTSSELRWKAHIFFRRKLTCTEKMNNFWFYCNSPNGYAHSNCTAILCKGVWSIRKVTLPLSKPCVLRHHG